MGEHRDKWHKAMIVKYGSEEAYLKAMREFGAQSDRTTPRGFASMDKEKAIEISRRGSDARWQKVREQKAREKKEARGEDGSGIS